MGFKKEKAKGRLDKYYKLAKEAGYRARAAFKLIQLNKKYHVLERSKVLLDLCAAPGSWCQVAAATMPTNSIIIGVDLAPIKPISRCTLLQHDITTDKCRAAIRQHLKNWKVDTVLHDGAPNVGTAWIQDAFSQAELVLQSLKLATEFLVKGGTFITKVFRSKDYNSLIWVFNQLFGRVEATKPPASRNVSAEIFVVCREYKAPSRVDPRFLDPKTVFAELADPTPNNEARVYKPEMKKRKREGYEEGDWTQFKEAPVTEFIQTKDPIAMLATLNKLSFKHQPNGDLALAALDQMPDTTQEIRECCADLKVLGRKDFKLLLRWRIKVREKFGLVPKQASETLVDSKEVAQIGSMDEELKMQEEMQHLKDQADTKKRKERRKENARKQKDLQRMQMNMTTPMDIGLSQAGPYGEYAIFDLQQIDTPGLSKAFARGHMHTISQRSELSSDPPPESVESDSDGDNLEDQLDQMYLDYQERRNEKNAKYRAKKVRKDHEHEEFYGLSDSDNNKDEDDDDEAIVPDPESQDSSDDEDENTQTPIVIRGESGVGHTSHTTLSNRAQMFFDQDIFKNITGLHETHSDSGIDVESAESDDDDNDNRKLSGRTGPAVRSLPRPNGRSAQTTGLSHTQENSEDEDYEAEEEDWSEGPVKPKENSLPGTDKRPNIDIITAEAMTLAHQLATSSRPVDSIVDDNFSKYSLRDTAGLPDWFLDDENQHSKPHRPITKEAVAAIREKSRALNARPIKKVQEAKARKKLKAARRLEKLKKKSAILADDEDMDTGEKNKEMARLMARAAKGSKPKKNVKVVVARGGNKGVKGRPRGTKGKYKMVDARLKKDIRGMKRAAKKK